MASILSTETAYGTQEQQDILNSQSGYRTSNGSTLNLSEPGNVGLYGGTGEQSATRPATERIRRQDSGVSSTTSESPLKPAIRKHPSQRRTSWLRCNDAMPDMSLITKAAVEAELAQAQAPPNGLLHSTSIDRRMLGRSILWQDSMLDPNVLTNVAAGPVTPMLEEEEEEAQAQEDPQFQILGTTSVASSTSTSKRQSWHRFADAMPDMEVLTQALVAAPTNSNPGTSPSTPWRTSYNGKQASPSTSSPAAAVTFSSVDRAAGEHTNPTYEGPPVDTYQTLSGSNLQTYDSVASSAHSPSARRKPSASNSFNEGGTPSAVKDIGSSILAWFSLGGGSTSNSGNAPIAQSGQPVQTNSRGQVVFPPGISLDQPNNASSTRPMSTREMRMIRRSRVLGWVGPDGAGNGPDPAGPSGPGESGQVPSPTGSTAGERYIPSAMRDRHLSMPRARSNKSLLSMEESAASVASTQSGGRLPAAPPSPQGSRGLLLQPPRGAPNEWAGVGGQPDSPRARAAQAQVTHAPGDVLGGFEPGPLGAGPRRMGRASGSSVLPGEDFSSPTPSSQGGSCLTPQAPTGMASRPNIRKSFAHNSVAPLPAGPSTSTAGTSASSAGLGTSSFRLAPRPPSARARQPLPPLSIQ